MTQAGNQFSWTATGIDPFTGEARTFPYTATLAGNNIVAVAGPAIGFAHAPDLVVTRNEIISASGSVQNGKIDFGYIGRVEGFKGGAAFSMDVFPHAVFIGSVTPLTAAQITAHSESITTNANSTVTFSVSATGTSPLNYQWLRNGVNLANGGNISGATSATLTLSTVSINDSGTYRVIVSNGVGTTDNTATLAVNRLPQGITFGTLASRQPTASPLTLTASSDSGLTVTYTSSNPGVATVNGNVVTLTRAEGVTIITASQPGNGFYLPATSVAQTLAVFASSPAISVPPQSQATCVGANVTFSVTATGQGSPFTYQWRSNGIPILGAMNSEFTLNNIQTNYEASYDVQVSNATNTVTSVAAALTVNYPPAFTQQPVNITVARGQSATFTAAASGKPAPLFQWRKAGANITGATSATYTISSALSIHAGEYDVVISNPCGTLASSVATLTVNGPVEITSQPQSQTQRVGATATFRVVAAGTPPLSYQWRRNGTAIPLENGDTLTVPSLTLADDQAGFDVVVGNVVGQVPSAVARLTVVQPPVIIRAPANQGVLPGTTVTFSVEATGTGTLSYQWKKDGAAIAGATGATYTVPNAQIANNGAYTVVVSNSQGAEERTAFLTVVTRQLKVGDVQVAGGAVGLPVSVPITLVGTGTETKVALSVGFDPAVVTFTTVDGTPAGAILTVNNPGGGSPVGVTVEMPTGQVFPSGSGEVARVVFATATATQVASALVQGDTPVIRQVLDAGGAVLPSEFANGSVTLKTPVSPAIANDTGLMGETVIVSTPPGTGGGGFVRLLVFDLGVDRLGNAIRLQNAAGTTAAGIPYVLVPAPAPGTAVTVALEYYVSDRTTVPTPRLVIETTPTGLPAVAGDAMALEPQGQRGFVNGFNGGFYLNFRTEAGRTYYVQYRDNATDPWLTSFPAVTGIGSYQQWIDTGPPRTTSPPAAAATRFYQVIRVP